jgi:hypothetical protein
MDKNKTFTIDIAELEFSKKDTARIGIVTGATICAIVGISAIMYDGASKLKKKYYRWKLNKCYNKVMNDPEIDEETKKKITEIHKKTEELY